VWLDVGHPVGFHIEDNLVTVPEGASQAGLCGPRKCNGILARLLAQQPQLATTTKLVYFEKYVRPTVGCAFQYQLI